MLRRLFACIALLTGLFALSAPVEAGVGGGAFGVQVERAERGEGAARQAESACAQRQRQQQARGERVTPCAPGRAITIVIPTIQLGPDRARE